MPTFLDDYYAYMDKRTWVHDNFKIASGLMSLSSVTHKKILLRYSEYTYYPNMYSLLLGVSGSGKETAIAKTAMKIVSHVNPDCVVGQDKFTPEGLMKFLSEKKPCHVTIFNDELGDIISAKKYMAGMGNNLITLYNAVDRQYVSIRYSEKTFRIDDPYISIFTGIQDSEISNVVTNSEVGSGFLPRFNIFYGSTKKPRPRHNMDNIGLDDLVSAIRRLKYISMLLSSIEDTIELPITSDTANNIYDYIETLEERYPSDIDKACMRRINDQMFKLVILYALNDVSDGADKFYKDNKSLEYNKLNKDMKSNKSCEINDMSDNSNKPDNSDKSYMSKDNIGVTIYDTLTYLVNSSDYSIPAMDCMDMQIEGIVTASRLISRSMDTIIMEDLRRVVRKISTSIPINMDNGVYIPYREIVRRYGRMNVQKIKPYIDTLIAEGTLGDIKLIQIGDSQKKTVCVQYTEGQI